MVQDYKLYGKNYLQLLHLQNATSKNYFPKAYLTLSRTFAAEINPLLILCIIL